MRCINGWCFVNIETLRRKRSNVDTNFSIDTIAENEPKINELIIGDIIGIYYEFAVQQTLEKHSI